MTTPNAETLEKWKQAEVLLEGSPNEKHWYRTRYDTPCQYTHVRPYRAPGHIQPHDGSAERPEWVETMAMVQVHERHCRTWFHAPMLGCTVNWEIVDYFIVLPEIR